VVGGGGGGVGLDPPLKLLPLGGGEVDGLDPPLKLLPPPPLDEVEGFDGGAAV
jgi:hypothetical protein